MEQDRGDDISSLVVFNFKVSVLVIVHKLNTDLQKAEVALKKEKASAAVVLIHNLFPGFLERRPCWVGQPVTPPVLPP